MSHAHDYMPTTAYHVEQASRRMQPTLKLSNHPALPTTSQGINRYVEQLLTPKEQRICDMATD